MSPIFLRATRLIRTHLGSLTTVVLMGNGPLYLAYAALTTWTAMTTEAADQLFGLVGLMVAPLINGAVVHIIHNEKRPFAVTLKAALKASAAVWTRMVASYIFLGLAVIAALAVTMLPPGFVLLILVQNKWASPDIGWVLAPFAAAGVLWVLPRYTLLEPLILLDGCEAYRARTQSRELTKPIRWWMTGVWLLTVGPSLALEASADKIGVWCGAEFGWSETAVAAAVGLFSALIYLVPLAIFYVVWRERSATSPEGIQTTTETGGGRVLAFPVRGGRSD